MKFLNSLFVLFFSLLLTWSCTPATDDDGMAAVSDLTVKIDGVSYDLVGTAAIAGAGEALWTVESLLIGAGAPAAGITSLGITLFLPEGTALQEGVTYTLCAENNEPETHICGIMTLAGLTVAGATSEVGSAMEIEFSSLDYRKGGHVKGTFSGTLVHEGETVVLTDGVFDMEISE